MKMKKLELKFLIVILLLSSFNINAQNFILNVNIKSKDGSTSTDEVISMTYGLKSIKSGKVYQYQKIDEITVNKKNESFTFYILETKLKYKSKKTPQLGIGYKVYDSQKLELFHVNFSSNFSRTLHEIKPKLTYNPNYEVFIRRKGERFAYNIGCVDGYGCDDIRVRLKDFFYDCSNFFTEIKKKGIGRREIIKISNLYNEYCN